MTDPITVTAHEHGIVRVFALVRPLDVARGEQIPMDQIAAWLGVDALQTQDVQQLWTDEMTALPLRDLLMQGYGLPHAELAAHDGTLDAAMELHPTVFVIIRSSAFTTRPVTLAQDGPLYLVAALREPDANVTFEPLPNPDPAPALQDPPQKMKPSDAAMSGRVATIALLVMAVLVWLMIKIAG